MDKFYVKRYEEETEVRAFLLVDSSGSMGYGRTGSAHQAGFCAAPVRRWPICCCGSMTRRGWLARRMWPQFIPPRAGTAAHPGGRVRRARDDEGGRSSRALGAAAGTGLSSETIRRRSLVVLVSDLLPQRGGGETPD